MAVQVQFGGVHIRSHNGLEFLKNAFLSKPQYDMPQNLKNQHCLKNSLRGNLQSDFFKE